MRSLHKEVLRLWRLAERGTDFQPGTQKCGPVTTSLLSGSQRALRAPGPAHLSRDTKPPHIQSSSECVLRAWVVTVWWRRGEGGFVQTTSNEEASAPRRRLGLGGSLLAGRLAVAGCSVTPQGPSMFEMQQ